MNKSRKKLAIVHFNPIELYPPVLNWLNYLLSKNIEELTVRLFTFSPESNFGLYVSGSDQIRIYRNAKVKGGAFFRLAGYIRFYVFTLIQLIKFRPPVVLYYETLSAFPVIIYKLIINRKASVYVHYHEYSSPEEYKSGMALNRLIHRWERGSYRFFKWISHTNQDRLRLFKADNRNVFLPELHILPNYPPDSWSSGNNTSFNTRSTIKLVYVGALNIQTMYVRELTEWVNRMNGRVSLDIYSTNVNQETVAYLSSLNCDYLSFHGGIEYYSLPTVLKDYHVGVILYKGHIPNYVYNAPNKLFEYYACGLDVWFPVEMKGSHPYITIGTYPKICAIDFMKLESLDLGPLISRFNLAYKASEYYCNVVFDQFYTSLAEDAVCK